MRVAGARLYLGGALIGALLVATFLLVGCSSGSDDGDATPTTTPSTTTPSTTSAPSETTTESAPEPITADEEQWVAALMKLQKRLEKTAFRSGVVTHARLLSDAKIYRGCNKQLGTEPSERFAPAFAAAARACRQFRKAGIQLDRAASNMDVSLGGVVAGTPQERAFNRAFGRGTEAAGNAVNTMSTAVSKAQAIQASLAA